MVRQIGIPEVAAADLPERRGRGRGDQAHRWDGDRAEVRGVVGCRQRTISSPSIPVRLHAAGMWSAVTLTRPQQMPAAEELLRFITTPRAMQAMIRGSGVNIGHFRPSVHVTLWS